MTRGARAAAVTAGLILLLPLGIRTEGTAALDLLGQIRGKVEAQVTAGSQTLSRSQELTEVAPGVFEATTSIEQQVDGVQVHASSQARVVAPAGADAEALAGRLEGLLRALSAWLSGQ